MLDILRDVGVTQEVIEKFVEEKVTVIKYRNCVYFWNKVTIFLYCCQSLALGTVIAGVHY